ncbi:MAG: hypothetical protein HGA49_01840 [Eubacteriaceae bacterium]|nr:hypothetical protein [Eubacteriaceae bacterium]
MKKLLFFLILLLLGSTLTTTAGCSIFPEKDLPFILDIIPKELNGHSIAGQHCVFLVTITDEKQTREAAVEISAIAPGAEIVISKKEILEGQVAEVIVIPEKSSIGKSIEVTITGNRGRLTEKETIVFNVIEGEDDRKEYAEVLQSKFIKWLESNHPEFGIKSDTKWAGTMVSPQWLVVSHYLFFSDEWEMHMAWHVMIPPYDWVRIDLRHRFDEQKPSFAFEISSLDGESEPIPIEVPESVWR